MMAAAAATFGADSGVGIDPAGFVGDVATAASPKPHCAGLLLTGFASVARGELADGATAFRQAFADCDPAGDTDLASNLGIAAMHLGEDAVVLGQYGRQVIQGREAGAVVLVLYGLTRRAVSEISTGDWAAAAAGSAEALGLARATGQAALAGLPLAWLTLLAAFRGDQAEYTASLAELEHPTGRGTRASPAVVRCDVILWAKGVASAATPAVALHHLEQMRHGVVQRMAAMDRLEAAVRAGRSAAPAPGPTTSPHSPVRPASPGRQRPRPMARRCSPTAPTPSPSTNSPSNGTPHSAHQAARAARSWPSVSSSGGRAAAWMRARTSGRPCRPSTTSARLRGQSARGKSCEPPARPPESETRPPPPP